MLFRSGEPVDPHLHALRASRNERREATEGTTYGANLLVAARTGYARPAEVQGAHRTSVVAMRPIRCSSRALVAS